MTQFLRAAALAIAAMSLIAAASAARAQDDKEARRLAQRPKGATVLFDGKDTSRWVHLGSDRPVQWTVEGGAMEVKPGTGNIVTKENYTDFRLHLEFMEPSMPEATSQARGNSGLYLQGRYEIQILDSYKNPTYANGSCGSIYGQKEPDQNVAKPPLQWQTYDVVYRAPRFDAQGKKVENPRVTVWWNGVKVHDHVEITIGPTTASIGGPEVQAGPIMLQDHGNKVKFRNIWILPTSEPAK